MMNSMNPRRGLGGQPARAEQGRGKFPTQGYSTQRNASRPAIAVLTPKGATCPYKLKTLPSGELALAKKVCGSKHFLRTPPAIALDRDVLKWAERKGASTVCIFDRETEKLYHASLATIWEKGFRVNRGFGEQQALPLYLWDTGSNLQLALLEA